MQIARPAATQPSSNIDTDSLSFINKDSEANNVENDFLAALNSVSKDFGAQKDELGVVGVTNVLKSQQDLEDKLIAD